MPRPYNRFRPHCLNSALQWLATMYAHTSKQKMRKISLAWKQSSNTFVGSQSDCNYSEPNILLTGVPWLLADTRADTYMYTYMYVAAAYRMPAIQMMCGVTIIIFQRTWKYGIYFPRSTQSDWLIQSYRSLKKTGCHNNSICFSAHMAHVHVHVCTCEKSHAHTQCTCTCTVHVYLCTCMYMYYMSTNGSRIL